MAMAIVYLSSESCHCPLHSTLLGSGLMNTRGSSTVKVSGAVEIFNAKVVLHREYTGNHNSTCCMADTNKL